MTDRTNATSGAPTGPKADAPKRKGALVKIAVLLVVLVAVNVGLFLFLRSRSVPRRLARLHEEARIHQRLGRPAEALKLIEEARRLDPARVELAMQQAVALESLGRAEEAERSLREAVAQAPGHVGATVMLADRLLARGGAVEADRLMESVIARVQAKPEGPDRAFALLVAGRAAAAVGAHDRAEASLREAARSEPRAPALVALAEVLAAKGDLVGAEASLRDARKATPDDPGAAIALARVLERAGKVEQAVEELQAVARTYAPEKPAALAVVPMLGDVLVRLGRFADARALADEVGKGSAGSAAASYVRASVALAEGDDAAAESHYEIMARSAPKAGLPKLLAARVALRRGAVARAREVLAAALAADPRLLEADLLALDLEERVGEWDAVRERAGRLVGSAPARPVALRALLRSYLQTGETAKGIERFESLAAAYPADPQVRLHAAFLRMLGGDAKRATAELEWLLEEGSNIEAAVALLAAAKEQSGDALEAVEELARIAASSPRFSAARVLLARIYARLGRRDLAARELDLAVKENPEDASARAARAALAAGAGDLAGALEDMQRIYEANPRSAAAGLRVADLRILTGDASGAIAILDDLRKSNPADARLHALFARAHAIAGCLPRALDAYAEARRLEPRARESNEDGLALLASGRFDEARAALTRAIEATGDRRFGAALAVAHALAGEPAKGLDPLVAWRSTADGGGVEGALAHALLLASAGDARGAEGILATIPRSLVPREVRAAAARAADPGIRTALEIFALRVNGWAPEVATRVSSAVASADAGPVLAWWALQASGTPGTPARERLALARRLAALAPQDPGPGLAVADALAAFGDSKGELETLRDLERRFPEHSGVALRAGMALERGGDLVAALEKYGRAVAMEAPSPVALNNFAYLLGTSDPTRLAAAIAHAERAARAAPQRGEFLDTLGWLLLLDGQIDPAHAALSRAVSAAPSQPTIRYHLARALEMRGEPDRAASHLEVALLSSSDFPEAADARARLAALQAEVAFAAGAAAAADAPEVPGEGTYVGATGADGSARLRIAPGAAGRVVSLRFRSPREAPSVLAIGLDGGGQKRLEAAAGEEVFLPRFALAPAGHVLTVRATGPKAAGAAFELTLGPAGAGGGETEPNDVPRAAIALARDARVEGVIDAMADRDCYRLDVAAGAPATLKVANRSAGTLRAELLVVSGVIERLAKVLTVPAGAEVAVPRVGSVERGALVLRVAPVGADVRGPYAVALVEALAGAGDPEPNDRDADAARIETGEPLAGTLGAGDPLDWYRAKVTPGDALAIRLASRAGAARAAPEVALELWQGTADGLVPVRAFAPAAEIVVPRWRAPREGSLYLVVGAPADGRTADYDLAIESAPIPREAVETEPNDRPALADMAPAGGPLEASLQGGGDRDWIRVPALGRGVPLSIAFSADPSFPPATVSVFSDPDRDPQLVATFAVAGGALEVPAVRLPEGAAAAILVAGRAGAAPATYQLTLGAGSSAVEAEPNDFAGAEIELASGKTVRGRLSGPADRDVFRVDPARGATVRATGAVQIAVGSGGDASAVRTAAPGEAVTVAPRADSPKPLLVEVFLQAESAPGDPATAATYEITAGEGAR